MKNKYILHGKQAKDEEIELTLGLSLNGKFGVEPKRATKSLKRSCSAVETTSWGSGEPLSRTSSLPVKNRKELLMVRRREAKQRMLEKQRSNGVVSRKTVVDEDDEAERGECYWSKIVSQRSTGSSGLSDLETQWTPPPIGLNIVTEVKSPQSAQSFSGPNEQATTVTHQEAKPLRSISAPTETVKNMLADMPCVSTKGDGPNGERIDGFLYKYKKGEKIKIVCVCHGSFLSPAEFIRHAGGGDVEHPLRHIVVNRSPLL